MTTVERESPRPHFMNPAYLLLYGVLATVAPMVVQFVVMVANAPDPMFWGIGAGILIWGSVLMGVLLSGVCLCLWMIKRSPTRAGGAYARAVSAAVIVGVLGAYPIGWLNAATTLSSDLGIQRSLGVLLAGIYLALVFGGYMLCWERREARR